MIYDPTTLFMYRNNVIKLVSCQACGANPGERCTSLDTLEPIPYVHDDRSSAYHRLFTLRTEGVMAIDEVRDQVDKIIIAIANGSQVPVYQKWMNDPEFHAAVFMLANSQLFIAKLRRDLTALENDASHRRVDRLDMVDSLRRILKDLNT